MEIQKVAKALIGKVRKEDTSEQYKQYRALLDKTRRYKEALVLVLPMAKAYAYKNPVGSNMKYIDIATKTLEDK